MAGRMGSSAVGAVPLWIVAVAATLFLLRAAKSLLIPIALAVLISYALEPMVAWMERHGTPRIAGTALVLVIVVAAALGGAHMLKDDAVQLLEAAPKAMQRAREMVFSQLGSSAEAIEEATEAVGTGGGAESARGTDARGASGTSRPITGSLVGQGVNAIFALAGHLVVIFFLVFFLLISGHHVKNRVVEIAGPDSERRRMTATIIDDINIQIQRYLLVLLVTAALVGVVTWLVLAWMGVQHAAIWGVLAGIFNSIPYFGPVIVAAGLLVAGIVQGSGITHALQMSGAAILITSLEGWLITPPLMGKAERMSALAVFLGLLLWTWVWGAWGTLLAVPMLVIIKSVADHLESLRPVGRLMAP
jgi:predicted PurR-regulated permease PerM